MILSIVAAVGVRIALISLNTPVSLPVLFDPLARAWSWWVTELRGLIPVSLRERATARPKRLWMDVSKTSVIVKNQSAPILARIDLSAIDPDAQIETARTALAFLGNTRTTVRLAPELTLRREIELPQSAERRLRDIVELDLDRLTPFAAKTVAFDAVIKMRHPAAGRFVAEVAVARRETIDTAKAICARLGLTPERIGLDDDKIGATAFDLRTNARDRTGFHPRRHPGLAAAAIILFLAALDYGLAIQQADARLDRLEAELVAARHNAEATEKLQADLARSASAEQLLNQSHTQIGALEILNALTRALPDNVWLSNLEISGSSANITGFSPSAPDILSRLDRLGEFSNLHFRAPVTRSDTLGQDRFEISFDLRAHPTP